MEICVVGLRDDFTKEQIKRLQNLGKLIFVEETDNKFNEQYINSKEEKILVLDPDIVHWKFPNDLIARIPNLKAICLMSTSYRFIDIDYCNKNNIIVTNVPKYATDSVAEYACFLMMAVARKLPIQIKSNFKEEFSADFLEKQIKGKKAGIVGLGTIGTRLAEVLTGMGMEVSYWSRNSRDKRFKYKELEELFKTSDFIFPTFSINDETRKIITDDLINSMKKTSSIITTLTTTCLNFDLILNKVKNNELYGFAFESNKDNLYDFDGNVMVTAQYAWYTKESLENCVEIWVQSVEGVATGNIVNRVQ